MILGLNPVNWGLKHNGNDLPPTPPDSGAAILQKYDGLYRANTTDKKIFLTFDLGYEAGHTAQILDILKTNGFKAIFFLCGNYLQESDLINRIIAEGHTVGNHTNHHKDLPTLSRDAITTDIMDFQNKFTTAYPNTPAPTFMRPPKGRFDEKTLDIAKQNGMRTMLWSIAIKDWGKTAIDHEKSAQTLAKRLHPGAIILLHITNAGMPKTLETLVPMLKERGYTVGNPSEI